MRPHYLVLFFIASSFVFFASARGRGMQEIGLESNAYTDWIELTSLLNLANVSDKFHETSPLSDLLGIQPDLGPSPDLQHNDVARRGLEALFSHEIEKIVQSVETAVSSTLVALDLAFHDVLAPPSFSDDVPSSPESGNTLSVAPTPLLIRRAARLAVSARDDFWARFPLPAAAPGHAERAQRVSEALARLQRLVVRLARDSGVMEQETVERHMARLGPLLRDVGVLAGDVAELYPAALEALVLNLSAMLLPEAAFLRSLVILYCFGPYVLGRDAVSTWLFKHASEALKA